MQHLPALTITANVDAHTDEDGNNENDSDVEDGDGESADLRKALLVLEFLRRDHVALVLDVLVLLSFFGGLQTALGELLPRNALPATCVKIYAVSSLYCVYKQALKEWRFLTATYQDIEIEGFRQRWALLAIDTLLSCLIVLILAILLGLAVESLTLRVLEFDIEALILISLCRHVYVGCKNASI